MTAIRPGTVSRIFLAVIAGPLSAQQAHNVELGGSVSGTRYDHLMGLPDHVGVLLRLGYFLTPGLELEAAAGFSQPHTAIPFEFTTVSWAGASAVLNIPPRLAAAALPVGGLQPHSLWGGPPLQLRRQRGTRRDRRPSVPLSRGRSATRGEGDLRATDRRPLRGTLGRARGGLAGGYAVHGQSRPAGWGKMTRSWQSRPRDA